MTQQLESWYRRLIVLYPAGHRAVFAEDMVGVLMEDARPEQARPQLRTVYDLLKGATAAWALRLREGGRAWQRAGTPAAISLIALFIVTTQSFGAIAMLLDDTQNSSHGLWGEFGIWLSDLIWLPVAAAALLGFRRSAAWVAWGLGVILPLIGSVVMAGGWIPGYLGSVDSKLWFAVSLIAATGLSAEHQHNRFGELGRRGTVQAAIGALIIGGLILLWGVPSLAGPADPWPYRFGLPLLVLGVALIALSCIRAVGKLGRIELRVTATAITVLLLLCGLYGMRDGGTWNYEGWMEQEFLAVPLMILAASLVAAWSMAGSASGALARGLAPGRGGPGAEPHSG
jgi:hypothetical protein